MLILKKDQLPEWQDGEGNLKPLHALSNSHIDNIIKWASEMIIKKPSQTHEFLKIITVMEYERRSRNTPNRNTNDSTQSLRNRIDFLELCLKVERARSEAKTEEIYALKSYLLGETNA